MKTNLNIAYLNGAEGMIRRGAASSGDSGSGGEIKWEYYRIIGDYETNEIIGLAVTCSEYVHYRDIYSTIISSDSDNIIGITKIACTNIPLIYKTSDGESICDKGSWKLNFCDLEGIDEEEFNSLFSPIAKAEFFTLEPISS